jgi:hypothetical protein
VLYVRGTWWVVAYPTQAMAPRKNEPIVGSRSKRGASGSKAEPVLELKGKESMGSGAFQLRMRGRRRGLYREDGS